jgi:GIY-YIG catalytic domain
MALKALSKNESIIIKPSDKGGAIVLMDRTQYVAECLRQLQDTKYYKELTTPTFLENIPQINSILSDLLKLKIITSKQYSYLSAKTDCRPRLFYILPKIHKNVNVWPSPFMPPGRPIISDCNSESYLISEYIDSFLIPLANKHPSYLKDTSDFLNKIVNKPIPSECLLVTGDVTSLYTNMDLNRTLATVKQIFTKYPDPLRPDTHLLKLLEITLKNNDFTFDKKFYLQTCGIAMGKKYAPSLANIYLIYFDKILSQGLNNIIPKFPFRFLDDVFFLWDDTIENLKIFETHLNQIIPGITITLNFHVTHIDFLDTTIYKCHLPTQTILLSRLYLKPTDSHQLLHSSSFHPPHTTKGILKSQILRFKRLSSTYIDFNNACDILFKAIGTRGYNKRDFRRLKLITWPPYKLTKITPAKPDSQYSCLPCGSKKCLTCPVVLSQNSFLSTTYNKYFPIKTNCNCNSNNLIYLITCKLCKIQYVGETGDTLRNRLNNHRSTINLHKNTAIALHFNSPNHSYQNLTIIPIEILTPQTSITERRNREFYWQRTLGTLHPLGLNNMPIDSPDSTLHTNTPQLSTLDTIPIVLPYNCLTVNLTSEWKKICKTNPNFKNIRFISAYSNNPNLKKQLVRTKL